MNSNDIDLEDKPLDPATEKLRKKMVRLLAVSIGVMMIGLMAVLGAIIYKFSTSGKNTTTIASTQGQALDVPGETLLQNLNIPAGAKILESNGNGAQILLRLEISDHQELWIYDVVKNQIIAKITVK